MRSLMFIARPVYYAVHQNIQNFDKWYPNITLTSAISSLTAYLLRMNAVNFIGGAAAITGGMAFAAYNIGVYAAIGALGKNCNRMIEQREATNDWEVVVIQLSGIAATVTFAYAASVPIITAIAFVFLGEIASQIMKKFDAEGLLFQFSWRTGLGAAAGLVYERCITSIQSLNGFGSVGYSSAAYGGALGGVISLAAGVSAYVLLRTVTFGKVSAEILSYVATAIAIAASCYLSPLPLLASSLTTAIPAFLLFRSLNNDALAKKMAQNLISHQNLIEDEQGNLLWKEKRNSHNHRISTEMNRVDLEKNILQILATAKKGDRVFVKLKLNEERHFVNINLNGQIESISKKIKTLGKGTYGKVHQFENNKKQQAAKFVIYPNNKEDCQFVDKSIRNEDEKLRVVNPNGNVRGLQRPPKYYVWVIHNKNKKIKHKLGYMSTLYDGDAEVTNNQFLPIKNNWRKNWTNKELIEAIEGLTFALDKCHKSHIYPSDIKPKNILRKGKKLYLADFGEAAGSDELYFQGLHNFTRLYSSAQDVQKYQAIKQKKVAYSTYTEFRHKLDVFALGYSLFEILTESPIFNLASKNSDLDFRNSCCIKKTLTKNEIKLKIQQSLNVNNDHGLGALISDMVMIDPNERITSNEVQQRMAEISARFK